MPRIDFDRLPETGRIWIFAAERPLGDDEAARLLAAVDAFLETWNAHGTPLRGARGWREDRFLFVGVDEAAAPPSGCSIDALVRVLKEKEGELGLDLLDHGPIHYRDGEGAVRRVSRARFRELARAGRVGPDTPVFDTSLTRTRALREGAFERPARESWHGKAFFSEAVGGG